MIQNIKFSKINTDVDSHEIRADEGEYRMMENLVPPKKGKGIGFIRESIPGTSEISVSYTGTHKVIGFFEDTPNNRGFYFLWEESGSPRKDRIYMYDASTKTTTQIVASEFLGWTADLKIEGISVLDDVIHWSDPEMKYYRIQDNTQLIEFNYYASEIILPVLVTYFFQVVSEDGTITVNVSASVTGPLSVSDILTSVADQFNANPSFSAHFLAVKEANAEVIKINAKSKTGNWVFSNDTALTYNYFSTNYDAIPREAIDFTMYPIGPSQAPNITLVYDASITINSIVDKNFQFAYRLLYTNNQISVLSPYSEFKVAARFPENLTSPDQFNAVDVFLPVFFNKDKLKSIELAARSSLDGDWFIVKEFSRNELFIEGLDLKHRFKGTEIQIAIPTADAIKQQEGQPLETIECQIQKNKIFVIENKTGFDVDPGDFEMIVTLVEGAGEVGGRYLKEGGRYIYSIRFFDDFMRTDGTVHKSIDIRPRDTGFTSNGKWIGNKQWVEISLSGKPPVWAHYYSIVRSDELFFDSFFQAKFRVHYFVRPLSSDETEADFADDPNRYAMWGNVYQRTDQNTLSHWAYIHIQMPMNLPYLIERGMVVNFSNGIVFGGYGTILDVQGPMMILEKPPAVTVYPDPDSAQWFEIFQQRTIVPENSFYEIDQVKLVGNPGESNRTFNAFSDPYVFTSLGDLHHENNENGIDGNPVAILYWKFDMDDYTTNGSGEADKGIDITKFTEGNFESYSASYSATQIVARTTGSTFATPGYDFGYILDPTFATRNLGRPAILIQNTREESRPSTLRWSNDYIENATINGLHTFEPLNSYPLPLERGPVNKLQNVGEDVMLAIHSSGVTSLYIGKGIIRSADLNPTLVTTEGVIGTDNQLKYSYGTIHPSSVSEIDGNAYFWDGVRNEPVRYAQNGLTPLATTFMARVFFKETIPSLFGAPDTYDCISEYDRLLNIVFFTFIKGATKLTIGFHETSTSWIGKVGFTPEYYGAIGDQFLGFVNGVPWLHNEDDVNHNTFYGVAYKSKVNVDVNINVDFEKAWMGMMVDSNKIWDVPVISNSEGQASNLVANDFVWRDNIYYADFLRDTNTPVEMLSGNQIALRHGKFLSSQVLSIEMELDSTEPHYLNSISVAAVLKEGHHLQREKRQ